jgi:hypothetical protein
MIVRLCQIRQLVPANIMPVSGGYNRPYAVKDPAALKAFLAGAAPAAVDQKLANFRRAAA